MKKILIAALLVVSLAILASCHTSDEPTAESPFTTIIEFLTPTPQEDIKLNYKELSMSVGQSDKIIAEPLKPLENNDRLIYVSSDASVAMPI